MDVRIELKPYDPAAAAETLLRALAGAERQEITVADAAILSGLPLDRCEAALIRLGARFESRVRTTDRGELLFTFTSFSRTRREGRARRALARMRAALRRSADRVIA